MRFYLTTFLLLAIGVVYVNYQISLTSEEESTKFIISQETRESLTANLLDEKLVSKKEAFEAKEELDSVLNNLQDEPEEVEVEPVTPSTENQKAVEDMNDLFVTEEEEQIQEEVLEIQPLTLIKSVPGKSITTWDATKPLTFTFSSDVDARTFFENFTITPSIDGKFSGEVINKVDPVSGVVDRKTIVLQAIPALEVGDYTLNIKKGMKSFDKKSELEEAIQIMFTIQ